MSTKIVQTEQLLTEVFPGHLHYYLSYDIAVIQRITSCHKNLMATRYVLACTCNVITTSVTTLRFSIEIMSTLKTIKSSFQRSYDKQKARFINFI